MSASRPRIGRIEVLFILLSLALASGVFVGIVPAYRESERVDWCSGNLRGLASAMYIYAEDGDTFPMCTNATRAGEMALFSYRNRRPLPGDSPSPTADLWIMLRRNHASSKQLVCPAAADTSDPIDDTTTVFDFAAPAKLSYAYAYQYHPHRAPLGTHSNPYIPLLADANPLLKGGVSDPAGIDRASSVRGNSFNHHARRGQNVAWVDGSVRFQKSPRLEPSTVYSPDYPSLPADNIYTTHADNEPADPGNAPSWTRIQIGSKSDYCLVP